MKSAFFVSGFLVFLIMPASAQDATDEARRRMSQRINGNTGSFVTPTNPRPRTVISYVTYLTKDREWTDINGRTMTARLVAYSAPKPGETGTVVVIHEGKVRMRRTGAKGNSDLPLSQLSAADQLFVKAIESGIKRAAAQPKPG